MTASAAACMCSAIISMSSLGRTITEIYPTTTPVSKIGRTNPRPLFTGAMENCLLCRTLVLTQARHQPFHHRLNFFATVRCWLAGVTPMLREARTLKSALSMATGRFNLLLYSSTSASSPSSNRSDSKDACSRSGLLDFTKICQANIVRHLTGFTKAGHQDQWNFCIRA